MAKKINVTLYIFSLNRETNRIEREEKEAWATPKYIKWITDSGLVSERDRYYLDRVVGLGTYMYSLDEDMLRAVKKFKEFNENEIQATLEGMEKYRKLLEKEHKISNGLWAQELELLTPEDDEEDLK